MCNDDTELIEKLKKCEKSVITIINKADKGSIPLDYIKESFENVILMSAKDEKSRIKIEETVRKLFLDENIDFGTSPIVTTAERNAALISARESVRKAINLLCTSDEQTIAGSLCEEAVSSLDSCSGRAVSEDIVNTIFSRFCVGK